ncbi:RNA polymerase sigma factor [Marinobacter zhejiangensis]|uniref:RNA polymerase sigma-70 factor, ECF subfamily n=1 Tax=Marinobacter zhejiangensis TaxID=488535 RepID=A0A1I4MB84_9GAMM|nr:RNA polymerase sigma factor [Marinobacter zhejiangensis]SFM00197.1 RNA polymerase sigma-70 factor, ECF subfamily [Marinobacter zhejiangensis]
MTLLPFRMSKARRFELKVQPHMQGMYAFAYRLTGQRDDAEDLVQDVMVKLFPRLEEVEAVEQLRPWLNRVLYRQFIDATRKKGRQNEVSVSTLTDVADQAGFLDSFDSDSADAFDHISQEQLGQSLTRVLGKLSPDQRTLLLLHDADGWRQDDIAQVLDVPVGTIKSRLHRCRARLRELLQKEVEPFGRRERVSD